MKGRLGIYEKQHYNPSGLKGIDLQAARLNGNRQQERMIRDKRRSLDHAVWYSYQGAEVVKVDATDRTPVRALINPNKLKQDYDDKVISVGYEYNFNTGTVFEWLNTNSFWLVYLQDLTELAYFRGDIRRCSYQVIIDDQVYYIALRGPVETRINYIQKHNISIDTPNHSLNLLIPKDEKTIDYFTRYKKFYLQGDETCWRVEAVDLYSTPGIIEVNAVEYYANEAEDDIENGVVGGLIEEIKNPNSEVVEETIVGETFIKVKKQYSYTFTGTTAAVWSVDAKYPVKMTFDPQDPRNLQLIWDSTFSGQFELRYGDIVKTIVVESLF